MLLGHELGRIALGFPGPLLRAPLGEREWSRALAHLARERMEGLLVSAVADARMPVTEEQERQVAAIEVRLVKIDRLLGEVAGAVSIALRASGITHRLLKGLALGRLDYGDPLWRSSGDVDLLVHAADYAPAAAVLESLGADIPALGLREKSYAAMFGSVEVDVHRRIVAGPVGYLADGGWFDGARKVNIDGIEIPVLDRERAFIHAALNAISNDWYVRPRALLDVALLASRPPLDLVVVRDLLAGWDVGPVVAEALVLASQRFPADVKPLISQVRKLRVSPTARLVCVVDSQRRRTYTTRLLAEAYLSSPTWRERAGHILSSRTDRSTPFGLAITPSPIKALRRYGARNSDRDPRY